MSDDVIEGEIIPTETPVVNISHIGLSIGLVNGVLGYLAQRPYGEVAALVEAIQSESEASVEAQKG